MPEPGTHTTINPETLLAGLRQFYPCGEARRLGLGRRPAVLVVDFIEGFTSPESPMGGSWDREISCTATLLEVARRADVPVVYTIVELDPGTLHANLLYAKAPRVGILVKGSRWTAVDHRLSPQPGDTIVSKQQGSAFFGTDLAQRLEAMGIDTLLLCGCVTSGCIRASAVDAAQHGFRPGVIRDAVGDRSALAHEANLIDIEQRYGDVLTLEQALDYLRALHQP